MNALGLFETFFFKNACMLFTWDYMNSAWNFRWEWILWDGCM